MSLKDWKAKKQGEYKGFEKEHSARKSFNKYATIFVSCVIVACVIIMVAWSINEKKKVNSTVIKEFAGVKVTVNSLCEMKNGEYKECNMSLMANDFTYKGTDYVVWTKPNGVIIGVTRKGL